MPPLNISAPSTAQSGLDASGSIYHASGPGDWYVQMGPGLQVGKISPWLLLAAAVAAYFLLGKK